ncbi:MAG: hypothetical protein L3K07_01925, partial [Thermoplasmata archaeon]|nr:hypothetical protein [Thermoplasmata archaeon]
AHPSTGSPPSIGVGVFPQYAAYDLRNGYVYVPNYGSNNVSVINGTKVIASVNVGNGPYFAAYDSGNGYIYVPNYNSGNVSIINGTSIVGTVPVGSTPEFATYDSGNGYVYVPNDGSDNVSVLNGTRILATVGLASGSGPLSATYDPKNGFVYVPDYTTGYTPGTVSVINGTKVVGVVTVGKAPHYGTYDERNGYVYVPNYFSGNTSVINGTKLVGTVKVGGGPLSVVYDTGNGFVYVTNYDNGTVSIVNGTTVVGTVTVGTNPWSITYNSGDGDVYVPNLGSANMSVLNNTKLVRTLTVGAGPQSATYDSGNGYLYVCDGSSNNITAILTWFQVTFTEFRLPAGTGWWVNITGGPSIYSNTTTLSFNEPDGIHSYSVAATDKSYSSPGGTFTVNGTVATESAIFTQLTYYPVLFVESGLPSQTTWTVNLSGTLNSSSFATIGFARLNGTYSFVIGSVGGFTPSPASGPVSVGGSGQSVSVHFTPPPITKSTYSVTLTETGLPYGTSWSVTFNGSTRGSSSNEIGFSEVNGTYTYSVGSQSGYSVNGSGNVTVDGKAVSVTVAFQPVVGLVPLTFRNSGLTDGTNWSVTLSANSSGLTIEVALTRWSDGAPTIGFNVSMGNYTYSTSLSGYRAASGAVIISGSAPATVTVPFVPVSRTTPTHGGAFALSGWVAEIGIGVIVVGMLSVSMLAYRFRAKERMRGKALAAWLSHPEWEKDRDREPKLAAGR